MDMGTPCTVFACWSGINRVKYPDQYAIARPIGEQLAKFAAEVAMIQLNERGRFLIENPAGSEMFQLPCFKKLWETQRVVSINVPQCALGLRVYDEPILKNTTL